MPEKFLTEEVIHSKYNVFPEAELQQPYILINRKPFYALSWLIARIGIMKDEGLKYYALAEGLEHTENITHEEALQKAFALDEITAQPTEHILKEGSTIIQDFLDEGIFKKIVR